MICLNRISNLLFVIGMMVCLLNPWSVKAEEVDGLSGTDEPPVIQGPEEQKQVVEQESTPGATDLAGDAAEQTSQEEGAEAAPVVQNEDSQAKLDRTVCDAVVNIYSQQIRFAAEDGWTPPALSTKGIWVAALTYEVDQEGKIKSVRLEQSSGDEDLDKAALKQANNLNWEQRPLPTCYKKETLEVRHLFRVIER